MENLNRGIRKYTKTRFEFTDELAAQKAVYLAIMNIQKNGAGLSCTGDASYKNF
jgi:transposase-like protein